MATECKAVGVVPFSRVSEFCDLLRGFCYKLSPQCETHEIVLKVPLQSGVSATEIRLSHCLPSSSQHHGRVNPLAEPPPDRWTLRHEGRPMVGGPVSELPVTRREVVEAGCVGSSTLEFWLALGCTFQYEMIKKSNEYFILHQSHDLKIQVTTLKRLVQRGNIESAREEQHSHVFVEVTCRVAHQDSTAKGQEVIKQLSEEAARAIASFGQRLTQFVELRKAEV